MKKVIFYVGILLTFGSCTLEPTSTSPCIDGNCDAQFWVDTDVNPGSYQDSNGVWHVKYSGRNYFSLLGQADEMTSEFTSNGVPIIETSYDSNFFFTPTNVQWTFPVYSFLGLYINNNLSTALPFEYVTQTIPEYLSSRNNITNLVGYEMTAQTTFNKPYSSTLLQAYSRYNYHPQHSMVFMESFIGKSADLYIKVKFGEIGEEVREYKIQVIFF
jgi:hypothetical protein